MSVLVAIVLFAHGIGHSLGLFPLSGLASDENWTLRSWLLTPLLGVALSSYLGALLWLLSLLGFILVALASVGWLLPPALLPDLAVPVALISLVTITLFWQGLPRLSSKLGAIAVNALLLYAVIGLNWSPA